MSGVQGTARPTSDLPSLAGCHALTQLPIDLMRLDAATGAKYKC